jgi:hypothetical protein
VVAKDILAMQTAIPELEEYSIVDKIGEGESHNVDGEARLCLC